MDGKGEFEYVANPQPLGPVPTPLQPDPRLHGTPASPAMQKTSDAAPSIVDGISQAVEGVGETIKRTIIGG